MLVAREVKGEAQEVNRLGPLSPSLRRMPLGKPTKFNEPRLAWFQYKPKSCQALAKRALRHHDHYYDGNSFDDEAYEVEYEW
ncbi:MAG: hypothetical protein ACREX3_09435 [Gammaproteobacteria bacterium]